MRAWLQLRETPLLGCICPDGKDKKCARLYSLVNENPCVGECLGAASFFSFLLEKVPVNSERQVSLARRRDAKTMLCAVVFGNCSEFQLCSMMLWVQVGTHVSFSLFRKTEAFRFQV